MFDLTGSADPELRPYLTGAPAWNIGRIEDIPLLRENLLKRKPLPDISGWRRIVSVCDHTVPSIFDSVSVRLRVYRPACQSENAPCAVFFRGSGFIIGHVRQSDPFLCELCQRAGCVIVSCDYRLAPEHPYPAAIEDCYSALVWTASSENSLQIDRTRIALMGVSAGGGLSLSVALMARDLSGPKAKILLPLYPMADHRNAGVSNRSVIDSRVWDGEKNGKGWQAYLLNTTGPFGYRASALLAETFSGLPPVVTYIGQLDALRDETLELVRRLAEDGVSCEFHCYPGCFHSFETSVPEAGVSRRAKEVIVRSLVRAFEQ